MTTQCKTLRGLSCPFQLSILQGWSWVQLLHCFCTIIAMSRFGSNQLCKWDWHWNATSLGVSATHTIASNHPTEPTKLRFGYQHGFMSNDCFSWSKHLQWAWCLHLQGLKCVCWALMAHSNGTIRPQIVIRLVPNKIELTHTKPLGPPFEFRGCDWLTDQLVHDWTSPESKIWVDKKNRVDCMGGSFEHFKKQWQVRMLRDSNVIATCGHFVFRTALMLCFPNCDDGTLMWMPCCPICYCDIGRWAFWWAFWCRLSQWDSDNTKSLPGRCLMHWISPNCVTNLPTNVQQDFIALFCSAIFEKSTHENTVRFTARFIARFVVRLC